MLDIPENNFSSLVIYFGVFISLLVHLEDFERQPGIWVFMAGGSFFQILFGNCVIYLGLSWAS